MQVFIHHLRKRKTEPRYAEMACIEQVLQFDEEFIITNQYPPTISLVKWMTAPLSPLTIR